MSMTSEVHAADPCPELPATFVDPGKMREIAREIKGFTSESHVSIKADEEAGPDFKERAGRPEMLVKSVVATSGDVDAFGPLLANAAYERGFHAAERKAFVADGSSTNWGVWRKYFSHYTPILDFVHALMYVYAAAMAGRSPNEGWSHYRDWAQWLWSGDVDRLLTALAATTTGIGHSGKERKGHAARSSRHFVGLPDQPTPANEIRRVPQKGTADHQQPDRINRQANQPQNQGDREILVRGS